MLWTLAGTNTQKRQETKGEGWWRVKSKVWKRRMTWQEQVSYWSWWQGRWVPSQKVVDTQGVNKVFSDTLNNQSGLKSSQGPTNGLVMRVWRTRIHIGCRLMSLMQDRCAWSARSERPRPQNTETATENNGEHWEMWFTATAVVVTDGMRVKPLAFFEEGCCEETSSASRITSSYILVVL